MIEGRRGVNKSSGGRKAALLPGGNSLGRGVNLCTCV